LESPIHAHGHNYSITKNRRICSSKMHRESQPWNASKGGVFNCRKMAFVAKKIA